MPRRARVDLLGTIHHVTIRGVDRMRIFRDDVDAADMLDRFEHWLHETGTGCLGWSFNGNHAHWVIVRRGRALAELIARFTSAYAQQFNRRHGRIGPLFQGRYRSRVVEGEDDLRWTTFYALANPVRHAICGPATVGRRSPHSFEPVGAILGLFGGTPEGARQNLRDLLDVAIATKWQPPWEARLERLVEAACLDFGIARGEFSGTSAMARAAQAQVARRAIRELGLRWRLVEARLGIPQSRIARALHAPS